MVIEMKVYQLIYTSVQHSLSDPDIGLANQSGLRVFSCTQGLTKQNVDEIIRFATYRLAKNNETEYSTKPCDPSVPELFPKIFRTFKLSDGRYTAMQISYAGYDFEGQAGNVFAHAFVFDEVDDDFLPERYMGHKLYRTHLSEKDLSGQIVHYLKPLDGIEPTEGLEDKVIEFIESHKTELTYILDKAARMMTSDDIKNLCIATNDSSLTQMYLLSLKWLLPRDAAENTGMSTYNVYLPSDKQKQIIFHGTVKGKNNITAQAVETHKNCIYIDIENTKFEYGAKSMLFKFEVKELREIYAKYKFKSVSQLLDWEATWENTSKTGIAGKLIRLKKSAGDDAFKTRVLEIYPAINDMNMRGVKFELSKIMFDNLDLFKGEEKKVTEIYMGQCFEKLCAGENIDIGNPFTNNETAKEQADAIRANLTGYMDTVRANLDALSEKNKTMLLVFLGRLKHASEADTWKELFDNKESLKLFVLISSQIVITGSGMNAFTPAEGWENGDLAELVAYFDVSTRDVFLKKSCVKYIYNHKDEDWQKYGVSMTKHTKTKGEQEKDIQKIRRMLARVGYIPYQRGKYTSVKGEVTDDIRNNSSPLLISRLLYAVYRWQGTYGNQIEAEKNAKAVRDLLLEMRRTQTSCYNFMIPKLALEIIESPGHYHEVMINTETMPPSFWNWFLIGYNKCRRDEDKMLVYTRVYSASRMKMSKVPAKKKMRKVFQDVVE
ncbi:MAG: hypothetical protein LIO53_09320 [Oscillospiraceae bacterium]|nr:hypothetical protein [Oscillospiraceae bacterium]